MTLLKRTISLKTLIYLFFIVLHLCLLNVNVAEWGDSYRILRASEYIRNEQIYPTNEKRPPLYSLILAARLATVEPVLWGRIFMLGVSVAFLYIFENFLKLFIVDKKTSKASLSEKSKALKSSPIVSGKKSDTPTPGLGEKSEVPESSSTLVAGDQKYINIGLLLLALNPVFLYWSLRIYADVVFSFFVLLSFYLLKKQKNTQLSFKLVVSLGVLSGLAVLTRFEGYLLFGAVGLGLLFPPFEKFNFKNLWYLVQAKFKYLFGYVLSFCTVVLPWFLYKNPFLSSYFEEPAGRAYDFTMVWVYSVSLLFIFGFTSAFYFVFKNHKNVTVLLKSHTYLTAFVLLELLLILAWPAAVPRLFVPVIPFFVLFLVLSVREYFENSGRLESSNLFLKGFTFTFSLGLLALYVYSQYVLKLQFLVPVKEVFAVLIVLQLFLTVSTYKKSLKWTAILATVSMFVWSLGVIYMHSNTFISIKNAAEYTSKNISGVVAYNDVSSVSDWYLNNDPYKGEGVSGYYYNFEKDALLTYESLKLQPLDYLLITNEHNTTMEIDLNRRPYLTLIEEFSYNVNGKIFTSRIVKFNKEYNYE